MFLGYWAGEEKIRVISRKCRNKNKGVDNRWWYSEKVQNDELGSSHSSQKF